MNHSADFMEWLTKVRYSRNICMLIPMEACMGYPIVVELGEEYIIPFFKVASIDNTDRLSPPFAYIRINYPSATVLTYHNLRTLPEWKKINWDIAIERKENCAVTSKVEDYYKEICRYSTSSESANRQHELLLECLCPRSIAGSKSNPIVVWYKKLIAEAKKYR